MSWVAVGAAAVTVAGSIYSSNKQSHAAKSAANAQAQASSDANATQLQMFNQSRQDQMPWLTTGASALNKLAQLYGLNTSALPANNSGGGGTVQPGYSSNPLDRGSGSGQTGNVGYEHGTPYQTDGTSVTSGGSGIPDYSAFYASPDYQFALQQGEQALDRSAAARGRLYSGGYGQDLTKYAQGMASQQLGNYTNRLAALAGVGQTASNNLSSLGQNYAASYGQNLNNAADARASSYAAQANAASNMANGIGQAFNYYAQYQKNNQWGGV